MKCSSASFGVYHRAHSAPLCAASVVGVILGCLVADSLAQSPALVDQHKNASERHKASATQGLAVGLNDPVKKEIAMQLVSCAENSSLDWKAQYGYIEYNVEGNEKENRGYTAGLVGFTTKFGDLSAVVDHYNELEPNNVLNKYTNALHSLAQSESSATTGLGDEFVAD